MDSVYWIEGVVQHYSWGRSTADSLVARLAGIKDEKKPCAELWFGAHPKAPSPVIRQGITLDKLIATNPEAILGARITKKFSGVLPFLFKVLSIGNALSIQAHPDKSRASELHLEAPQNYPDANHKPEIAVAISELIYLAGFVPQAELETTIARLPELGGLLPATGEPSAKFCALFTLPSERLAAAAQQIRNRLLQSNGLGETDRWFLKLYDQFGPIGDPGLFAFYLLRLGRLKSGQGLFTGPNIVHAYLNGEIVECMANSDNVVRAGLTEKYKDVDTLVAMIEAGGLGASSLRLDYQGASGASAYPAPTEEFLLEKLTSIGGPYSEEAEGEVELVVSVDGVGTVTADSSEFDLKPGTAFIKTATGSGYSLDLASGTVFRVLVP